MTESISQVYANAIGPVARPPIRFTHFDADVMTATTRVPVQTSHESAAVLGKQPAPLKHFSQLYMNILCSRTPSYRFNTVILPDVFPFDISYNSVGSTRFATDVIVVDSGDDQRVGRWDQPLMEYDVAYGVRTMEQLYALVAFFRAMRGRLYAFNYRDNMDFTSSVPTKVEARAAPPILPTDQVQFTGDNAKYVFQLIKTYSTTTQSQVRPITRPEPGTVSVAINGVAVTNWSVDTDRGVVTFSSPLAKSITAHSVSKSVLGLYADREARISGQAGDFTQFAAYVGRRVTISGFSNQNNNIGLDVSATISGVATDGSYISIYYGAGYGSVADTATNLVLAIHPAPPLNAVVTAGYRFLVPCRFDTDTLPVTLEDYGVGGSNSVKLIEVRPSAW